MGNQVNSAVSSLQSMMKNSSDDVNLEEKLPDGDKYFGFVNVRIPFHQD